MPHISTTLPANKVAIYSFIYNDQFLKIGKANSKGKARYQSHHYNPKHAKSNLAKSILNDHDFSNLSISEENIAEWIKANTRRIDFLFDEKLGFFVLNFIEAYLQLIFKPKYEGFKNQNR